MNAMIILHIPFQSSPEGARFHKAQGNALGYAAVKKSSPEGAE